MSTLGQPPGDTLAKMASAANYCDCSHVYLSPSESGLLALAPADSGRGE
jgi:hypothetical protein